MNQAPIRIAHALLACLCAVGSASAAAADTPPPPMMMMRKAAQPADPGLLKAVSDSSRSPKFVARDPARHPVEELTFFGLKPDMTVLEIWPGGGYWTEILAPYLKPSGHYMAAVTVDGESKEEDEGTKAWRARFQKHPEIYGAVKVGALGKDHYQIVPPGSVDLIVTFRNLHNWMNSGYAEPALKGMFAALKPGGILGIEDHRGSNDKPQDPKAESGYVRQDYTIELARKAGFEFVGASEVSANPKDTKDYPQGVWTLPPTLTLGDQDRAKYVAIGESDRYVLKFRKGTH